MRSFSQVIIDHIADLIFKGLRSNEIPPVASLKNIPSECWP